MCSAEIAIFERASGLIDVRLTQATVWLSPGQRVPLPGCDRSVMGRHIAAVFADQALDEAGHVQEMHIPPAGKPTALDSLDVIISVGCRVKSREGARFRQWAGPRLRPG